MRQATLFVPTDKIILSAPPRGPLAPGGFQRAWEVGHWSIATTKPAYLSGANVFGLYLEVGHSAPQRAQRSMGGAKYLAFIWFLRTESP
jgi:hypothetical protein